MSRQDNINASPESAPLITSRFFGPFFVTQFCGAFNDNIFKTTILISFTFFSTQNVSFLNNLGQLCFVLPFFLFSAWAGNIADRVEKSQWIQRIKLLEIAIMCFGALCLLKQWTWGLILLLFAMGTQSSLFGPVKYSIIPQHVKHAQITKANAYVETGTFLAILCGNLIAGVLFGFNHSLPIIGILLILVALLGWLSSRKIPTALPEENPDGSTACDTSMMTLSTLLKTAYQNRTLFLSMLGVAWFWFLGAAYLTQLPEYTHTYLNSNESVISFLLIAFSIGIGIGSLLCSWLSAGKIEIGLVPLGALGICVFGFDLTLVPPVMPNPGSSIIGLYEAVNSDIHWRVFNDLVCIGISGGLYIVPLYGLIQTRSKTSERARMIAASNILNAFLMVLSALFGIFMLTILNTSLNIFFFCLIILNLWVTAYIFTLVPEFIGKFLVFCLIKTMYRVKINGLREQIPSEGPAILIANHVSYVDALIIGGLIDRPARFVMYKPIYDIPGLNLIFKTLKAIPIDSKEKDENTYHAAFDEISETLKSGKLLVIFPEGKITHTGEVNEFKPGLMKILKRDPVPVIPLALCGLWGSYFSRKGGPAFSGFPKRFWSSIQVNAGPSIPPEDVDLEKLRNTVLNLMAFNTKG